MWIAVLTGMIPGFFGSKPFVQELKSPLSSYEDCEANAHSVARLGGLADIDPNYKVSCRKVDAESKTVTTDR